MKSIQRQLTVGLMAAVVLLFGLAAAFCYARTAAVLGRQFDSALEDQARALCALVQQDPGGRVEVTSPEAPEPAAAESADTRRPRYLQVWDADGKTLERSHALGGRDLTPPDSGDAVYFWDATLPDGRPGRAVRLRFTPALDADDAAAEAAAASATRPSSAARPPPVRRQVTLALVQDREPVRRVERVLLGSLLLTFALLCGGVLVVVPAVVRRGLGSVQRLSAQAARIDASRLADRFPVDDMPAELRPICQRLNDLLGRLEAAFRRERQFSADVAHELRTPIAELRTLSEVALRWPGDEAAARRSFQDALAIARQMEAVVTTLLALARCESGRLEVHSEPVDLGQVIREAWRPLAPAAAARNLTASFDLPDDTGGAVIPADRAMVGAIVTNLLSNAATYCPAGGAVECGARPVRHADGPAVELWVWNTNDSLAPEDLDHVLQPFWRKDAARTDASHSGLGLALVSAYAAALGADLKVALTTEGRFRVTIRFRGQTAGPTPPRPADRPAVLAAP